VSKLFIKIPKIIKKLATRGFITKAVQTMGKKISYQQKNTTNFFIIVGYLLSGKVTSQITNFRDYYMKPYALLFISS